MLDVDGVINVPRGMDKRLIENLKRVVEETQCKIVLSSDWRRTAVARKELRSILRSFGMDFISCTPPSRSQMEARRPEEIIAWLANHKAMLARGDGPLSHLGEVEAWVAIDDRALLSEPGGNALQGHFVQTHFSTGLTATRAQQARDILMGKVSGSGSDGGASVVAEATACRASRHAALRDGGASRCKTSLTETRRSLRSSLSEAGLQRVASTPSHVQAQARPQRCESVPCLAKGAPRGAFRSTERRQAPCRGPAGAA
mmetsp:Transcript_81185/g.225977  ORF Transcript_81185/g.225977 Transcript_81185/m.225977 type:complete len:258 (-) Transcript_81185:96-869(-)